MNMKSRCENSVRGCSENFSRTCLNENEGINDALLRAKKSLLLHYSGKVESDERLLKLALREAEALAWQTEYPHLVFPLLAAEKAHAAFAWASAAVRDLSGRPRRCLCCLREFYETQSDQIFSCHPGNRRRFDGGLSKKRRTITTNATARRHRCAG